MIQPIDLRLNDSKTDDYFAQMKQRNSNNSDLQAQVESQIVREVEKRIEQSLGKINSEAQNEADESKNKVGIQGLNESLNKVVNMNSVFFQFEFLESKDIKIKFEERKKELILKVIDKETKEVLSQYPTEISIKIAKMLDQLVGRGQLANKTI
jgi:uncharacterized FlaG/YvyC family protein